ncbi:hypothetical protein GCM10007901_29550 [Dyella acidisoli]|uniref:Uncharacterized protein n=1 Tax=Dyella acidisoli TaxID=1867834 RepID=A0ABQ5XQK7_9GAMM|nr:hypothetical protein GCM10007901_29550 [Dyella acidisoli]
MYDAMLVQSNFAKFIKVANTIDVGEEAWLPIVAALDNVLGNIGEIESGLARHGSWVRYRVTSS